jgi:hypothetical protein
VNRIITFHERAFQPRSIQPPQSAATRKHSRIKEKKNKWGLPDLSLSCLELSRNSISMPTGTAQDSMSSSEPTSPEKANPLRNQESALTSIFPWERIFLPSKYPRPRLVRRAHHHVVITKIGYHISKPVTMWQTTKNRIRVYTPYHTRLIIVPSTRHTRLTTVSSTDLPFLIWPHKSRG